MRLLMMLVIGLGVGAGIWYVITTQQQATQVEINEAQNSAQDAAEGYRQNQAEMMLQLEQ